MTPAPNTRDALLKAAGELLVEEGYAGMTTAAVAKRAGVAEGTIYRHFASKEALAEVLFVQAWDHLCEATESQLPPRDMPRERLMAFVAVSLKVWNEQPVDSALCHQEHMYWMNTCGMHTLPPGPQRFVGLLEDSIRVAQSAGVARLELDPRLIANFLFHGVGHLMERFVKPSPNGEPPAYTPEAFIAQMQAFLSPCLLSE